VIQLSSIGFNDYSGALNIRAEWSTEINIKQMYDVLYHNMVEAGIARKLDNPVMRNSKGEIVENAVDALGLPTKYELIHPDHLIFFDETGCNTNQKKDGHYGGQKYACGRGMTPKTIAATRDKHFTVLGLTAATGEPILCVVIFASDNKHGVLVSDWAEGIDIRVLPERDENGEICLEEVNFGNGKYFPCGPICNFRGKQLKYLPLASPSGGITGELLLEIMRWLDDNNVYERGPGLPIPFLVVDGHNSRWDPDFVDYITNPDHEWKLNFGIPHATSYWQVGDSSQQNGHFKMLLAKAKSNLVKFKIQHNIPIALTGSDIIPLVNIAWDKSFANVTTNQKAIAERGWGPLNYNLLLHKEIQNSGHKDVVEEPDIERLPRILNSFTGFSGIVFNRICQFNLKHGGRERNRENIALGETIQETLRKAKKFASSVIIKRQVHDINNQDVMFVFREQRDNQKNTERTTMRKRRNEVRKRIQTINNLRLLKPDMTTWNMRECKDFIQYKKNKGDTKMPNTLPLLLRRCREISCRASPDCSQHDSDEEYMDGFDDVEYGDFVDENVENIAPEEV
jgi:hypothetical protein